jgi:Na+-driven multidrug efflux pump
LTALFPSQLMGLFSRDQQIVATMLGLLPFVYLIVFPKSLNAMSGCFIRGSGNTRWMMFTQFGGTVLFLTSAAVLAFGLGAGLAGILWAVFIDESTRGLVNLGKARRDGKRWLTNS